MSRQRLIEFVEWCWKKFLIVAGTKFYGAPRHLLPQTQASMREKQMQVLMMSGSSTIGKPCEAIEADVTRTWT